MTVDEMRKLQPGDRVRGLYGWHGVVTGSDERGVWVEWRLGSRVIKHRGAFVSDNPIHTRGRDEMQLESKADGQN